MLCKISSDVSHPRESARCFWRRIMDEAMRVLRPGGAFAVMEMNPYSAFLDKLKKNLFAFTALKSTEPYLDEYMAFDFMGALKTRGFHLAGMQIDNSPRHRTIVAFKP